MTLVDIFSYCAMSGCDLVGHYLNLCYFGVWPWWILPPLLLQDVNLVDIISILLFRVGWRGEGGPWEILFPLCYFKAWPWWILPPLCYVRMWPWWILPQFRELLQGMTLVDITSVPWVTSGYDLGGYSVPAVRTPLLAWREFVIASHVADGVACLYDMKATVNAVNYEDCLPRRGMGA